MGKKGLKSPKNRGFGLLRKMPISNTTVKDLENLISYLNSWWNVLWDWWAQLFLYLHSFTPKNGCKVGQYKNPNWPKNRVFGLLRKIESLIFAWNDLKWSVLWLANFLCKSHIWENSHSRDLGPKVGGAVGKNNYFFIFCIKLESKWYKLPQTHANIQHNC